MIWSTYCLKTIYARQTINARTVCRTGAATVHARGPQTLHPTGPPIIVSATADQARASVPGKG